MAIKVVLQDDTTVGLITVKVSRWSIREIRYAHRYGLKINRNIFFVALIVVVVDEIGTSSVAIVEVDVMEFVDTIDANVVDMG